MGVFWENIIMAADALAPYMCVVLPGAQRVLINVTSLQWRHSEHDGVSNHQPHDCLLNRLFRRRSKKTSKFRVTGLCEGNSPVTGEFPQQRVSNTKNVSIWWRHHSTGQNIICIYMQLSRKKSIMAMWIRLLSYENIWSPYLHDLSLICYKSRHVFNAIIIVLFSFGFER